MMSARVFLSVMFAFIVLGAKAEGSQWLTNVIAEQEGVVKHQSEKLTNNQGYGFFSTHGLILFYDMPHEAFFERLPLIDQCLQNRAVLLPPVTDSC